MKSRNWFLETSGNFEVDKEMVKIPPYLDPIYAYNLIIMYSKLVITRGCGQ